MPEHLQPPGAFSAQNGAGSADEDRDSPNSNPRRVPSRSPHPYHRQKFDLLEPSGHFNPFPAFARDSPVASESGTEADDEHFMKGLPAPRTRLHKGLRGKNEPLSGTSTPLLSPAALEEEGRGAQGNQEKRSAAVRVRRRNEVIRRATEVLLLVCQGGMVASNPEVQPFLRLYRKGNECFCHRRLRSSS